MNSVFERRLRKLSASAKPLLAGGKIGLEKECLRVSPNGMIAQTAHPRTLGSTLTHPYITTDYSEALLEFITPPLTDSHDTLHFLDAIHQFVQPRLSHQQELLWAASMPCVVDGENSIRIAEYGRSNRGWLKHIYRRGLGYRYGKVMQAIAGVHFNYSVPEGFWPLYQELEGDRGAPRDFSSARYFDLIRNVRRYSWLLLYLFGCSPALCKSFLRAQPAQLQDYDSDTYYLPYATALRMSDIGYTNKARCAFKIRYDDLATYSEDLRAAVNTSCPAFERIGVKDPQGEYRQLNTHILQIENEYYSVMRPKQPPASGETVLQALCRHGVQYVELRTSDLNAFAPGGVTLTQLQFLEAFLLFCLLYDSPPISPAEQALLDHHQIQVARAGRDPALRLQRQGHEVSVKQSALELCAGLQGVCELLDRGHAERPYASALELQRAVIDEPERTPSARVLAAMRARKLSFFQYAKDLSEQHQRYFRERPLPPDQERQFIELAERSLSEQQELEASDTLSFDEYLRRHFAQSRA